MKLTELIRTVIFAAICLTVIVFTGKAMIPDYTMTSSNDEQFYDAEKNSLDVMFFGSSSMLRGTSPLTLYGDKKITAQTRASTLQAPHITYMIVKEALKTQTPKVAFITPLLLFDEYKMDPREANLRIAMDDKKLSMEKLEAINEIVKNSEEQDFASYVLPLLRYHDRWKEPIKKKKDKTERYQYAKGQVYILKKKSFPSLIGNADPEGQVPAKVDPHSKSYYEKSIKLCKEKGIKVVLLIMPRDRWDGARYLAVKKLAEESNVDFIDMNQDEHLIGAGVDFNKDFYDSTHANAFGSVKITRYLGDYLEKKCGLGPSQVDTAILDRYESDFQRFVNTLKEKRPDWKFNQ